jgi:hypothetical protein
VGAAAVKGEDYESESSEIVQTESENDDEEEDEDEYSSSGVGGRLNRKIHRKIKQLLGDNFKKGSGLDSRISKTGEGYERTKHGRGKWHYASDQKYGFNVSYSNGDTIISMGQVFII